MADQRISIKDATISIDGELLAGVEELAVTVSQDSEEAYEAGSHDVAEIVSGKRHIAGTITLSWTTNDLLNKLAPPDTAVWPSFTLNAIVTSGKTPGRSLTIHGAQLDSFDVNTFSLDSFAKNALPFKAKKWKLE